MSLTKILKTIRKSKSFLISTHVNPDPDALSSELAMALFLESLGKKVYVINEEPVPERFKFLPRINMIRKFDGHSHRKYDVVIILDCGDLDRIGLVRGLVNHEDQIIINIDHHITNDYFGDINWVRPQASSTAEVLFDVLKKFDCTITRDMAVLLYLGIMTDTGSFRYETTSGHTHHVVSELMCYKIPIADLYRKLYEAVPLQDLRLFTKVVAGFKIFFKGKVAIVELPQKIFSKFSHDFDLRDKIFKYLRTIKDLEVIVILTEHKSQVTRVNLRSHGQVDVARIAAQFNGGGHSRASGCMIEKNLVQAKKKILSVLKSYFR